MRVILSGFVRKQRQSIIQTTAPATASAAALSRQSVISSSVRALTSPASGSGGNQHQSGINNNNNKKTSAFKSPANKMADKVSSDRVKHDRTARRFTLDLGNNQVARIDYTPIGRDQIEMYHSEVPVELRGRGLGKALARGALEQAARENMRVRLTCSYLIDFVNKSADPNLKRTLIS